MWFARLVARRSRTRWVSALRVGLLAAMVLVVWGLLLRDGRTDFGLVDALVDALVVPVVVAAVWFGLRGAAVAGLAGALVAGPLLPLAVAPGGRFGDAWLIRGGSLLAAGLVVGWLGRLLDGSVARGDGLYEDISRVYASTLRSFMRLVEFRDEETSAHCDRVARNALAVGHHLGLGRSQLEVLYWAGYLHDLGKLGTPASILIKPGRLTEGEYEIIKQHAAIGADVVVGASKAFGEIALGVRHHHERWDGSGYPAGLSGRRIPLVARILAVVDMFEAMTSDRPYRKALPVETAREIVQRAAGAQVDPEIAELFLRLEAAGKIHIEGRDGKHTGMEAPDTFDPGAIADSSVRSLQRRGAGLAR